jgi:hypothetical protein
LDLSSFFSSSTSFLSFSLSWLNGIVLITGEIISPLSKISWMCLPSIVSCSSKALADL